MIQDLTSNVEKIENEISELETTIFELDKQLEKVALDRRQANDAETIRACVAEINKLTDERKLQAELLDRKRIDAKAAFRAVKEFQLTEARKEEDAALEAERIADVALKAAQESYRQAQTQLSGAQHKVSSLERQVQSIGDDESNLKLALTKSLAA